MVNTKKPVKTQAFATCIKQIKAFYFAYGICASKKFFHRFIPFVQHFVALLINIGIGFIIIASCPC